MPTGLLTPTHIAIVLAVLLLVFGRKRLPQTARALGRGIREFKHGLGGGADSTPEAELEPPPKP
jgi:sec-independent protein translocase protein TatA